jgi:hypothetical protein
MNHWNARASTNFAATTAKIKIREMYSTTLEAMQPMLSVSMDPTLIVSVKHRATFFS